MTQNKKQKHYGKVVVRTTRLEMYKQKTNLRYRTHYSCCIVFPPEGFTGSTQLQEELRRQQEDLKGWKDKYLQMKPYTKDLQIRLREANASNENLRGQLQRVSDVHLGLIQSLVAIGRKWACDGACNLVRGLKRWEQRDRRTRDDEVVIVLNNAMGEEVVMERMYCKSGMKGSLGNEVSNFTAEAHSFIKQKTTPGAVCACIRTLTHGTC